MREPYASSLRCCGRQRCSSEEEKRRALNQVAYGSAHVVEDFALGWGVAGQEWRHIIGTHEILNRRGGLRTAGDIHQHLIAVTLLIAACAGEL